MKKLLVLVLLLFAAAASAAENDSIADKIDFHLSNTPSETGDKTFSYFRWFYDDNFSTGIYFLYEKRKTDSALDDRAESLLVTDSKDTVFDFFPVEYRNNIGDVFKWRAGAGFNMTKNKLEEDGYFITSPTNPFHPDLPEFVTTNHVFKNRSESVFYTGKIQLQFFFRIFDGYFNIDNRSEYIPYYYLKSSQETNITPLVINGPVSNNYKGSSGPYLMNEIKIHLLKLFEIQYQVEYQKLKYEQINVDLTDTLDWVLVVRDEQRYTIKNYSLLFNFRPDIFEEVDFILGFGKKWLNTKNESTGEKPVDESEWVYNIGVTSKKM